MRPATSITAKVMDTSQSSCVFFILSWSLYFPVLTSGQAVLHTEISPLRDLMVLQFCFCLCSPTFDSGCMGRVVTVVRIWSAVGEIQILDCSHSPPCGIRSWTAVEGVQILDCSHSHSPEFLETLHLSNVLILNYRIVLSLSHSEMEKLRLEGRFWVQFTKKILTIPVAWRSLS